MKFFLFGAYVFKSILRAPIPTREGGKHVKCVILVFLNNIYSNILQYQSGIYISTQGLQTVLDALI